MAASVALAGAVGTAAGFEDDDGNLDPASPINFDWNSFDPTTWSGTAPYQTSTKTQTGWSFTGLSDAEAVTSDTNFNGGVKQDDNCAKVGTGKSSNKDDLKRIYVASKTVGGDVFLELAWVRIPQNTTSPSAHVAFEFNQSTTACPTGSNGLVQRSAANGGDMLIVYDFEGGSGDAPVLTLRRWIASGACEISSDSPPCWGTAVDLTASGFAEAKVNVASTSADTIAPSDETLGLSEFGEAGVNLTDAGVFSANACTGFGKAFGVSRSSGNSGTAQMKDLVGPGNISLTNCGQIKIIKQTSPRGVNQSFGFTSTIPASSTCVQDATPAAFSLNDNGNTTANSAANTEDCTNVPAGTYTVTEGNDPTGFAYSGFSCTATGTGTSADTQSSATDKTVSITIAGGGVVTCTYTNNQQLGAIKIVKTDGKLGVLSGAKFAIEKGGTAITGSPFTTDANGVICVDQLPFGSDYTIQETEAPSGYQIDNPNESSAFSVDTNAACADATYVGEGPFNYTNTPLSKIQVKFFPLTNPGVTAANIVCTGQSAVSENGAADSVALTGVSVANPTVITAPAHGIASGKMVKIAGTVTNPPIDGLWKVSNVTTNTFTIPVNVTSVTDGVGTITPFDDTDEEFTNLVPGTYTCTVIIDP